MKKEGPGRLQWVDETELDQLLQNIMEKSEEASENYDKDAKEKQKKVWKIVKMPKKSVGRL